MEVIIKGDAKEIAELLTTTIRHNEKKVVTYGQVSPLGGQRQETGAILDCPVVVALTRSDASFYPTQ